MKIKLDVTIKSNNQGFYYTVPEGTICEVEEVKGDRIYFKWNNGVEEGIANIHKSFVQFIEV
ncbi:hypothetical protein GCM10023310_70750 [Paenibacillus vulneris]|uniref:Uncharacterized protein n=1 Tax=Paenibacillus vulneris TaxID=1133364 RepID=A0ABW3UIA3_9BACL